MLEALFSEIEVIQFSNGYGGVSSEELLEGRKVGADSVEGLWVGVAEVDGEQSFTFIDEFKEFVDLWPF